MNFNASKNVNKFANKAEDPGEKRPLSAQLTHCEDNNERNACWNQAYIDAIKEFMFAEKEKYLSLLETIAFNRYLDIENAIMLTKQLDKPEKILSELSMSAFDLHPKPEERGKPVWLRVEDKALEKFYRLSQIANLREVFSFRETVYDPLGIKAELKNAMGDYLQSKDETTIRYDPERNSIITKAGRFVSDGEIIFWQGRALAQRELVQSYGYKLTGDIDYIAASASYILMRRFGVKFNFDLALSASTKNESDFILHLSIAQNIAATYAQYLESRFSEE